MPSKIPKGEKRTDVRQVAGPASYSQSSRPTVRINDIVAIEDIESAEISGGYDADVVSTSGNTATVEIYDANYGASSVGPLVEVAAGTDLSSETITITARGV